MLNANQTPGTQSSATQPSSVVGEERQPAGQQEETLPEGHPALEEVNARLSPVIIAVFALMICPVASINGQQIEEHLRVEPGYQSASVCRECHSGIYRYWANSMHALAATGPVFQASYLRAQASYGQNVREYCLSCHSPTTNMTGDFDLQKQISREGVTCDFCHTVTGIVNKRPQASFETQPGNTKYGPYENLLPAANLEFQYSPLQQSAILCSGCHELTSPAGARVLETYSEWHESSYARKGIQCQNCHMPELINVPIVDPGIRPSSTSLAHAHEFLGGHSQIRLEKAASLVLGSRLVNGKYYVQAFVTNEEAGHKLPTGMPIRKVILTVSLNDASGKVINAQTREYRKIVVDKNGVPITSPERVLMESAAVKSDNRIKPKETRLEQFEFDEEFSERAGIIRADLKYVFQADSTEASAVVIPMTSAMKTTVSTKEPGFGATIVPALLITVLLLILVVVITRLHKYKGR